ncbi:MAG: efflux RND transporter permease subunit [Lachnospiraceae bacterium]
MFAKLSVSKPYTVLVGVVMVIVLGVVSLSRMTADLLPNMELPYALVITTDPGASPEEIETQVTAPIEAAMAMTSNIKNVSSASYQNYSMVILEYEQSANMDSVMIEMRESLAQLESGWGDSVSSPMIMQIDPDMMPVMVVSADVEGLDGVELSEYVNKEILPSLESLEGVASASGVGGLVENIQITIDQDKVDALNEKIQASIDEQFLDAQTEIDDAQSEIDSGQSKIESGEEELANGVSSASNELNNQKITLYNTESDLNAKLPELSEQQSQLETAITGLEEVQEQADLINEQLAPLNELLNNYTDEQLVAMGQDPVILRATQAQLVAAIDAINAELVKSAAGFSAMDITISSVEDLPDAIKSLEVLLSQVKTGIATIQSALASIAEGKTGIDEAIEAVNKNAILGSLQMAEAKAQLSQGESQLDLAQEQLDTSKESAYDAADANDIITEDTIESLIAAQNFSMPAGSFTENETTYQVRVGDEVTTVEDLEQVILMDLKMDGVDPIRLIDVADISMADNTAEVYARVNNNPAIMISVEKQTGYSTGDVSSRLKERFETLQTNDEALSIHILMDQGIYIEMVVDTVIDDMIIGAILAIFILLLFLKDIRPTLVIACSIPLSVIFAVVLMYFSGVTLNIISLGGLSLGIGMLVDNSIVVIENIYRLRNKGLPVKKAAIDGTKQVAGAIMASTLTTVSVFAPIIFTEGITRQLFVDMGLTIAYSLMASLVIALSFVPMMSSGVLRKVSEKKHPWLEKVQGVYGRVLSFLLRFKILVFLTSIILLVGSVSLAFSKGTSFMPEMVSDQMTVTVTPDTSMPFTEMTALADEVSERLLEIEGIETVGATAGNSGQAGALLGSTDSSVTMYVLLNEETEKTNEQYAQEIAATAKDLPCTVSADSSMMDMSALTGSGISVQIKGRDLTQLQSIAQDVSVLVSGTEGTTDVEDGIGNTTPEIRISVDKDKAMEYQMTVAQIYQIVYQNMVDNTSTSTLSAGARDYEIFVHTDDQSDMTLEKLKNLTFTYTDKDGDDTVVSLNEVADFTEVTTLTVINRDAQERFITVTAGIADGYNVGLVSADISKQLNTFDLPEGYSIKMTGEDEAIADAQSQLYLMLVLALILIYLIMVAQFQSLLSPFIIMFTIPLAFTGGFAALYMTGNEVSVIALIGFVMLAGIIVNNGIVMIDYMNRLRRSGMERKEAIITASQTRLRPILMTAMTTILAMSAMALGVGKGSEMMQPMAIVTIGGLVYGTLLTLIVEPCLYDAFTRFTKAPEPYEDEWEEE